MEQKKELQKKKKLLIATDNFLPRWDGISRFLNEILPLLATEYELTIVAPDFGKVKTDFTMKKIELSKYGLGDYKLAKLKPKLIKKLVKKSDMVFTQTVGSIGATAVLYARKYKKPVVSFIHSIEWELVPMSTKNIILRRLLFPFMRLYCRFIYNKSDLLILPSEGTSEIVAWQKIHTKKKVVYLGVNSSAFMPQKDRTKKEQKEIEKLKEKLGLKGLYVVGNHGRLAKEKDLFTLIRAFSWLTKKYEDVRLVIIGDGHEQIREKLKATKNVILIPRTNEVEKYLNLFDVYVTTSLTETTSLATLEAMASGLPVISTPVGFIKEYIHNDYNGFLIDIKDNYAIYKTINLLRNNPELAKKIGQRARKSVLKQFEWKQTAEGILDALKSLPKK